MYLLAGWCESDFGAILQESKPVFCTITAEISTPSFGYFLLSISGQTHEFIIYAMRQLARADNLTICIVKDKLTSVFNDSWQLLKYF